MTNLKIIISTLEKVYKKYPHAKLDTNYANDFTKMTLPTDSKIYTLKYTDFSFEYIENYRWAIYCITPYFEEKFNNITIKFSGHQMIPYMKYNGNEFHIRDYKKTINKTMKNKLNNILNLEGKKLPLDLQITNELIRFFKTNNNAISIKKMPNYLRNILCMM